MEKTILTVWAMVVVIFALAIGSARAEEPDYGNDCSSAEPIEPNGIVVEGTLNPAGDEDWFSFTAAADGLYEISLWNLSGSKYVVVYGPDGCPGSLQQILSFGTGAGTITREVSIASAGTYYIKIYYGSAGLYRVSVLSPEPQCGDSSHPYPSGDINQDCMVNLKDFAIWTQCYVQTNN